MTDTDHALVMGATPEAMTALLHATLYDETKIIMLPCVEIMGLVSLYDPDLHGSPGENWPTYPAWPCVPYPDERDHEPLADLVTPSRTPSLIGAMGERTERFHTACVYNAHEKQHEAKCVPGDDLDAGAITPTIAETMPLAVARAAALALLPTAPPEARALLTPASGDTPDD